MDYTRVRKQSIGYFCSIWSDDSYVGVIYMKSNMKCFLLFFIMGISCGSVFGLGLSVALKNILLLPIFISTGTVLGVLMGLVVKKSKDRNGNK